MATINIDDLATEIMRDLETYYSNTIEDVEHAVKLVAKETAQELRETSPESTGAYSESWSYKRNREARGKDYNSMVVYAKKPGYRVSHLLENGHDKVNDGWVAARPHIKPAEEKAGVWLEDMLTRRLRK